MWLTALAMRCDLLAQSSALNPGSNEGTTPLSTSLYLTSLYLLFAVARKWRIINQLRCGDVAEVSAEAGDVGVAMAADVSGTSGKVSILSTGVRPANPFCFIQRNHDVKERSKISERLWNGIH